MSRFRNQDIDDLSVLGSGQGRDLPRSAFFGKIRYRLIFLALHGRMRHQLHRVGQIGPHVEEHHLTRAIAWLDALDRGYFASADNHVAGDFLAGIAKNILAERSEYNTLWRPIPETGVLAASEETLRIPADVFREVNGNSRLGEFRIQLNDLAAISFARVGDGPPRHEHDKDGRDQQPFDVG